MVKLAKKQTVELWHYLRQGFEEIMNSDENRLPVKSVNQVSPKYKCSTLLSGYIFKQILTELVENVATIKQVEYLNLGIQFSGLGFDVIEG